MLELINLILNIYPKRLFMYSIFIRFIYAFSSLPILSVIAEVLQLVEYRKTLITFTYPIQELIIKLLSLHYPLILLSIQISLSYIVLRCAKNCFVPLSLRVTKSSKFSMTALSIVMQVLPLSTFFIDNFDKLNSSILTKLLILFFIITIVTTMKVGIYNMSIALNYHQYKITNGNTKYLLISRRTMNNFNCTIKVVEISDRIIIKGLELWHFCFFS